MGRKQSSKCAGKVSGNPLMEYDTREEAEQGATHALERYGSTMVPYSCSDCFKWHLSPANRQTATAMVSCHCTDGQGDPKEGYATEKDASRRAKILQQDQDVVLYVYPCPEQGNRCWHLTKQEDSYEPNEKSSTCTGHSGEYLTEYRTLNDARQGATLAYDRFGKSMKPYSCSKCGHWHIGIVGEGEAEGHKKVVKSSTCQGNSGSYLTEYDSEGEALHATDYVMQRYGKEMKPYTCSKCGKRHIGTSSPPQNRSYNNTKSSTCKAKTGSFLTEYRTEQDAEEGATYALERYGQRMSHYKCSKCHWWHIGRNTIAG